MPERYTWWPVQSQHADVTASEAVRRDRLPTDLPRPVRKRGEDERRMKWS